MKDGESRFKGVEYWLGSEGGGLWHVSDGLLNGSGVFPVCSGVSLFLLLEKL